MKSPVLFLIFKREDTTRRVFERIREVQPPKLYIAADGPRADRPDEKEKCEATRKIVENIDWPCEVHKLFQDKNLGCGKGVSTAITWFFENEPEGIIVEDDILAHPDFFRFCDEMLEKYRDDERVMIVSGHNNFYNGYETDNTCYLSRLGAIWGWATWRRAWNKYEFDMSKYSKTKLRVALSENGFPTRYIKQWLHVYDMMGKKGCDTWDFQWAICRFVNHGMSVSCYKNLTCNIGFNSLDAAHTNGANERESKHMAQSIYPFVQSSIVEDKDADLMAINIEMQRRNIIFRAFSKLRRITLKFLHT